MDLNQGKGRTFRKLQNGAGVWYDKIFAARNDYVGCFLCSVSEWLFGAECKKSGNVCGEQAGKERFLYLLQRNCEEKDTISGKQEISLYLSDGIVQRGSDSGTDGAGRQRTASSGQQ